MNGYFSIEFCAEKIRTVIDRMATIHHDLNFKKNADYTGRGEVIRIVERKVYNC
jgi:hypothetical protein